MTGTIIIRSADGTVEEVVPEFHGTPEAAIEAAQTAPTTSADQLKEAMREHTDAEQAIVAAHHAIRNAEARKFTAHERIHDLSQKILAEALGSSLDARKVVIHLLRHGVE